MKKISSLVLVVMLFFSLAVSANTSAEFKLNANTFQTLNQEISEHTLDAAPYLSENFVMMPLRAITEAFGFGVEWNPESQGVSITGADITATLVIGSSTAYVNGVENTLPCPAVIIADRTMVPLDFFVSAFGYNVDYINLLGRVMIYDKPVVMTVNSANLNYDEYKYYYYLYKGNIPEASDTVTAEEIEMEKDHLQQYLIQLFSEFYAYYDKARESGFTDVVSDENTVAEVEGYLAEYEETPSADKPVLAGTIASLIIKNKVVTTYLDLIGQFTAPSDEDIAAEYANNYITAKHILIPTVNLETGEVFSDSEKAAAASLAKDIASKLGDGEDFDELMDIYSEDKEGLKAYPNGYTFTKGEMIAGFEDAVFALAEYEISEVVETEIGFHIIKRLPLEELDSGLSEYMSSIMQSKNYETFINNIHANAEISVNHDLIAGIE